MSFLNSLLSSGIGEVAKGIGSLAIDIRTAITGDLPPKEKAELEKIALALEGKERELQVQLAQVQSSVIIAEAKSESWLASNWRPLLMTMFGTIIANNYILFPYIELFFGPEHAVTIEIPPNMWELLKLGVSGYVVGRSLEKIAGGDGLKSVFKKIAG
jgi:hypothetical protein